MVYCHAHIEKQMNTRPLGRSGLQVSPLCFGGNCVLGGCMPGFRNCDGNVQNGCEVNSDSDFLNCGGCRQSCGNVPNATAACGAGKCIIGKCNAGFDDCNKNVADGCEAPVADDPKNCGACGKACPAPPNVVVSCANSVCGPLGQLHVRWRRHRAPCQPMIERVDLSRHGQ